MTLYFIDVEFFHTWSCNKFKPPSLQKNNPVSTNNRTPLLRTQLPGALQVMLIIIYGMTPNGNNYLLTATFEAISPTHYHHDGHKQVVAVRDYCNHPPTCTSKVGWETSPSIEES